LGEKKEERGYDKEMGNGIKLARLERGGSELVSFALLRREDGEGGG